MVQARPPVRVGADHERLGPAHRFRALRSRWRSALEGAVSETVAVANAEGAALDAADTLAELDGAHAELGSSMQRDILAGRVTELDAIAGAVLRAGKRHGLRCPTVQWLAERVAVRAARTAA